MENKESFVEEEGLTGPFKTILGVLEGGKNKSVYDWA